MIYLRELYTLVAAFAFITLTNSHPTYSDTQKPTADSTIIEHHLDGSIAEWPAGKFSTDEETKIRYMADNDSINLYLALSVPDQGMQMKMSRIGMKLYIDLKGKKKESMGIEFPLKKNYNPFNGIQPGDSYRENMKEAMTIAMIQLKLFGFSEEEPIAQQRELPGSAQIVFNWDTTGALNIEYLVPLTLLGNISSLNQKTISLGWEMNKLDQPSVNSTPVIGTTPSSTRGRPSAPRSSKINEAEIDRIMKEQKFWTKFTFDFR